MVSNNDQKIKQDVEKLQQVSVYEKSEKSNKCEKYILIIGFGGDIDENTNYLSQNKEIKFIDRYTIQTKYYWSDKSVLDNNNLNLFLYQVNEI
jgi:hypothetical protein